ncbi:hypothetical protein MSIMFI_05229 [Mycobacterium simulans]|uniref:hypothetical protein n=1 Tax=Mycobacterium simulans TaxID=627089 RepID=UPI00174C95A2|nr:hypothetical protein [Mycobacterium simulans]SON63698.1 hypothetical protein MSIMFI_05229 [Mycobacterium simulans]
MADDELDSLYWAQPDAFTAQRTRLTAAARKRGDAAAARRISAARRPTTTAWIVNRLALEHRDTKQRLADLGDRLRAAHSAMDGDQIRDLSAEQHKLLDELARAAFAAADVHRPSSTVRDDVTSTLQAAVADPAVRDRLGRLTRAEQWSGFGAFGDAAPVVRTARAGKAKPEPKTRDEKAEHQRLEKLNAAVAAAKRAKVEADATLSERQAERDAARLRRDEARTRLRDAQWELNSAENRYEEAKRASRAAAELVDEAHKAAQRS